MIEESLGKIALNKIIQGDCLEVMKDIPDNSINCIICDLPYGTTACSWDVVIPFDKLWEQYKRIRKDNTPIVLFGSEPFSTYLRMSNIKEYKYDWIYIKEKGNGFARAKIQPLRQTENISVFYKEQPFYDYKGEILNKPYIHTLPIKKSDSNSVANKNIDKNGKRILKTYEFKSKTNIIYCPRQTKGYVHPTQKPVNLLTYLIETYTKKGEIILDNCSGSGSLAIAAHQTDRKFICIEKDENYYKLSCERLKREQMKRKLF